MSTKPALLRAEPHPTVGAVLLRDTGVIIDRWAKRIELWRDGREPSDAKLIAKKRADRKSGRHVFTYFDNSIKVHAPRDAIRLAKILRVS